MRKTLFILVLAFCVTAAAIAADDHDDNAPVEVGYAVITPTATAQAGIIAMETFGFRHRGAEHFVAQAGVLPPDLTTSAVLFVESSGRLARNLGVAMVNPNSTSVTVTLTLRDQDGAQRLTPVTLTLTARQQTSVFVTDLFRAQGLIQRDFTGTLSITATAAISIVGIRFRGQDFSTISVTNLSATSAALPTFSNGVGGPSAILLPQFAAKGGWATEIVVINRSTTSPVTVRVDLFKPDGSPLAATLNHTLASTFTNLTIPAGGMIKMAPLDNDGNDDF